MTVMIVDTSCLYSTVRNRSGNTQFFGYLPPHGVTLAPQQQFSVWGSILEAVASTKGGGRRANLNSMISFERDIQNKQIEIVSTPSPILNDVTTGEALILKATNGVLSIVDPCFESSVASPPTPRSGMEESIPAPSEMSVHRTVSQWGPAGRPDRLTAGEEEEKDEDGRSKKAKHDKGHDKGGHKGRGHSKED